jgi:hypothetical protein
MVRPEYVNIGVTSFFTCIWFGSQPQTLQDNAWTDSYSTFALQMIRSRIPAGERTVFFSKKPRPAVGPTKPPI